VVDESGQPLANAGVSARSPDRRPGDFGMPNLYDVVSAGGRFELKGVRAGTYVVLVQASDHVDQTISDVKVKTGATTDVGKVVLPAGGVARGVVVDASGTAIPGARVTAEQQDRGASFGGPHNREVATDGAGRFEMKGLPPGPIRLKAQHKRYAASAPVEVNIDPATGPAEARITLLEGARLEGTARRRDGGAVTGAMVQVMNTASPGLQPGMAPRADGTFEMERLTPGKSSVILLTGYSGRYHSVMSKDVELRDGETAHVDLTLMDVLVSGRLTRGGRPLGQYKVRFSGDTEMMMSIGGTIGVPPAAPGPPRMEAVTGPDGRYELLVGRAGTYSIRLEPQGREKGGLPAIPSVMVPDAEAFAHDIALPDWSLTGIVLDKESKRPIFDATVEARPVGATAGGASMRTEADGRFQVAVEPGSYRVRALAKGYVAQDSTMTLGSAPAERAFELVRGSTLKGHVRLAGGQGVEGAQVVALAGDAASSRNTNTLMDGSFAVEGLPAGSYRLFAGHPLGFALQDNMSLADPVEMTLSAGAKVRVQVKDERGAPLARTSVGFRVLGWGGTRVGIEDASAYGRSVTTDDEGILEMVLPLGAVDLVAWAGEKKLRGEAQIAVLPQTPDVTVTLKARR
jgi:carboxypeptidase family protein